MSDINKNPNPVPAEGPPPIRTAIGQRNTDRELWREPPTDTMDSDAFYQPSIHVTAAGGIGINVGGLVIVKPLREWHAIANSGGPPMTSGEGNVHTKEYIEDGNYWCIKRGGLEVFGAATEDEADEIIETLDRTYEAGRAATDAARRSGPSKPYVTLLEDTLRLIARNIRQPMAHGQLLEEIGTALAIGAKEAARRGVGA